MGRIQHSVAVFWLAAAVGSFNNVERQRCASGRRRSALHNRQGERCGALRWRLRATAVMTAVTTIHQARQGRAVPQTTLRVEETVQTAVELNLMISLR